MMDDILLYFRKHSGEDPWIIDNCGHLGIQQRFTMVGAVAALVGLFSFVSCWYSFQMLFDNMWMAIPVSVLFGWMINNIYEVLLTTLSKQVMAHRTQGVIKHLSLSLRIGFIVFFAVFISKPLEACFFEPQLAAKVAAIKTREIRKAEKQLSVRTAKLEKQILADIRKKEHLRYPEIQIEPLRQQLRQIRTDNDEALQRIRFVVGRADYFVQRLQILTSGGISSLSWIFTLLMIFLFLLPVRLKWKINKNNPYFKLKKASYEHIVTSEYQRFKHNYAKCFAQKYQIDVQYHEAYTDAPFNTKKPQQQREYKTGDDFFKMYWQ